LLQQRITCESDNMTYAKIAIDTLHKAWLRLPLNAVTAMKMNAGRPGLFWNGRSSTLL
jgi:hypothetical protein